jgi:hypothetical protein
MKKIISIACGIIMAVSASAKASEITNFVNITTNLVFYLTSSSDHNGPISQARSDEQIDFMLMGTVTNYVSYRHFPSGNFAMSLFDQNGSAVAKAEIGLKATVSPRMPEKGELEEHDRRFPPYFVDNRGGECRRLLRPDEMFVITNNGTYELEVRINLFVIMTNGVPDLSAMTDWRNIHGPYFITQAKDFGILTSPPLRIKIIKE